MFKYLVYVSVLLSTTSSYLVAMETVKEEEKNSSTTTVQPSKESTQKNRKKQISQDIPLSLKLYLPETKRSTPLKSELLHIYFKNEIPGLDRSQLSNIKINSNSIPYIISYNAMDPIESHVSLECKEDISTSTSTSTSTSRTLYMAAKDTELNIQTRNMVKKKVINYVDNKRKIDEKLFHLPLNATYQELTKIYLTDYEGESSGEKLLISLQGTAYPGGEIKNGEWIGSGKGEYVSVSSWCPFPEVNKLYVNLTNNSFQFEK